MAIQITTLTKKKIIADTLTEIATYLDSIDGEDKVNISKLSNGKYFASFEKEVDSEEETPEEPEEDIPEEIDTDFLDSFIVGCYDDKLYIKKRDSLSDKWNWYEYDYKSETPIAKSIFEELNPSEAYCDEASGSFLLQAPARQGIYYCSSINDSPICINNTGYLGCAGLVSVDSNSSICHFNAGSLEQVLTGDNSKIYFHGYHQGDWHTSISKDYAWLLDDYRESISDPVDYRHYYLLDKNGELLSQIQYPFNNNIENSDIKRAICYDCIPIPNGELAYFVQEKSIEGEYGRIFIFKTTSGVIENNPCFTSGLDEYIGAPICYYSDDNNDYVVTLYDSSTQVQSERTLYKINLNTWESEKIFINLDLRIKSILNTDTNGVFIATFYDRPLSRINFIQETVAKI